MSKKYEFRAFETTDKINALLKSAIKNKFSEHWSKLKVQYSDRGGFDFSNKFSVGILTFLFSSFVRAKVTVVSSNWADTTSKIVIGRKKMTLYYLFNLVAIVLIVLIFIVSLVNYYYTEDVLEFQWHVIPIVCVLVIFLIDLWASIIFKKLVFRILDYIETEGIELEKF